MITPAYSSTATERVLPRLALDFTTAVADARVGTARLANTATRFNSIGLIEVVNANLPRFDFDPSTLICKGQLIEEARTNLFLNSLINGTNLTTQSVTLSAVAYTLSFYGSGSIAISGGHSATVAGIGAFPNRKTYTFTPTAGSSTFTVTGDVKFAQLEAGAFATSYIPTTTSSLTRNADVVSMTGANFSSWWDSTAGTFLASYQTLVAAAISAARGILAYDSNGNKLVTYIGGGSSGASTYDGSTILAAAGSVVAAASKTVMAYSTTDRAISSNGGTVATGAAPSAGFLTATSLNIGSLNTGNTSQINGYIRAVNYWPQRLTNSEIRAFSK